MTKATVCLATAFCAVFAIGCSSSSSNNDGGAGKDSSLPVFADAAGNPLTAPAGGACPGLPCSMPQKCCLNPLSMTGNCQDPDASCGGILTGCSSPSECMDPQVCCGKAGGGGGGFSIQCTDPTQCTPMMAGGFVFRLCDSTHACPTGQTCMAPPGGPGGGRGGGMGMFCFNPNMFNRDAGSAETGAPAEAGPPPEAGPSEAGPSEAGPSEAGPSDAGTG